jgi:hypothetical protein
VSAGQMAGPLLGVGGVTQGSRIDVVS